MAEIDVKNFPFWVGIWYIGSLEQTELMESFVHN